ncbi:MAG: DUF6879 family protein [Nocardioides sp.]
MLVGDDFQHLFHGFEHTAFRLEVRESYNSPLEVESLRQFIAGESVDLSWAETWDSKVRQATSEGRRYARVRIVSMPLSDYNRFGLWASQRASDAGEEIRYLPRDVAERVDLPQHDYWLFDSRKLVRMHFGEADKFQGGEVVEDTSEIVKHNYWRDVARHHAIDRNNFEATIQ